MRKVQRKSLLFTIFNILSIALLTVACKDTSNNNYRLDEYFRTKHSYNLQNDTKAILVLTEEGCPSCNKMFSDVVLKNAGRDNVICLVNAGGAKIDITPFEAIRNNMFFDADNKDSLFANSKVIFLKNKEIDTIVPIKANTIQKDFDFINSKL